MGDYTKLIVNCEVKTDKSNEDFREEVLEKLGGHLRSSAYHCEGEGLYIGDCIIDGRKTILLANQHKYSDGIDEFLDWLEPNVTQGFGAEDYWAIIATEYGGFETRKLREKSNEE